MTVLNITTYTLRMFNFNVFLRLIGNKSAEFIYSNLYFNLIGEVNSKLRN